MADDFYVYVYFRLDGRPCYVGKGRGDRWLHRGRLRGNKALASIKQKAGGKLPRFKVCENLSESEAYDIEYRLIKGIGRFFEGGPLVNIALGGPGTTYGSKAANPRKNWIVSEDTKKKIGDANRGRKFSEEVLAAMRGRPVHPNTIAAVKKANTGRKHTEETRMKVSAAGKGRKRKTPLTEEQRARLSAAQRGKKQSAETIAKRRISNAGYRHSEATRAKISESHKGKKLSDEHKAVLIANRGPGMLGRKHSEETKRKISEAKRKK